MKEEAPMEWDNISNDTLLYLLQQVEELEQYKRYNKLHSFKPYPFQEDFYKSGANYQRRFLCAANRVGKSFSAAYEMALHLTGQYPDWWNGKRFDKPVLAWAVGITGDSTRKVLQKELLGTVVAKDEDAIGTGTIPRDCLDFNSLEREGNKVKVVRVKHVSGGWSTLEFRSTQQGEHVLMGATVDYIWLDEEDAYRSLEIFSQCTTRTATTNGQVVITATPENGLSPLVRMFQDNEKGLLYMQNATWNDAPHLDEDTKKELLASIPSYQHDMRSRGIPVLGSGAVFGFDTRHITVSNTAINYADDVLWAIDIAGKGRDDTVLTLAVKKHGEGVLGKDKIVVKEQYVFSDQQEKSAVHVASFIAQHQFKKAPMITPADAGGERGYAAILKDLGVNVAYKCFHNPLNTTGFKNIGSSHSACVATGIHLMEEDFRSGNLKIDDSCTDLLKEITTYARLENGKFSHSDVIDSARYASVSLLANRGKSVSECLTTTHDYWEGGQLSVPM
ncbi:hypothetical protein G3R49_19295 [Shewanella sp. WXL01]|uniref:terminase large subunit domain-containing protein n=1 Tax=Shewanella sp. WXL01 TaxID=2709721 RepID=UPI0014384B00|nr:terminase family protein [Shewanella sp. WXL01]NKF52705.1 hypothetical protein [Shewanella sp. WXL01]